MSVEEKRKRWIDTHVHTEALSSRNHLKGIPGKEQEAINCEPYQQKWNKNWTQHFFQLIYDLFKTWCLRVMKTYDHEHSIWRQAVCVHDMNKAARVAE